ncbi:Leu/Ile/Val-binding protein [bacterium HR23]|nr:Leu/Ile/Val-binding protein [bacterium HR23]
MGGWLTYRRMALSFVGVALLGLVLVAGLACRAAPGPTPTPRTPAAPAGPPAGAPKELKVALVDFLSGPPAKFGTSAINAGKMLLDQINQQGGIRGVPIRYIVVDEAGAVDKVVAEFRRLVLDERVDAVIGYTSSSNCLAIAPVAEELKTLTLVHICGTSRLFEDNQYKYVFRTSAHQALDNISAALYVLKVKPDVKTIAGINDDYAWGRDSWAAFKAAMLKLKPDVKVVDELWPRLYQGEYSAEITKLLAEKPDVIHTSLWGGHMDAFIKQAEARGLFKQSLVVMTTAETALLTLGKDMPDGVAITGRGQYLLRPDQEKNPLTKKFVDDYVARYNEFPIYPAFRMAQAVYALKAGYEKAIDQAGRWPTTDQVIKALEFLEFDTPTGRVKMALGNGHQAVQDAVWGITSAKRHDRFGFPLLEKTEVFKAAEVNPAAGMKTEEWIQKALTRR